MRAVRAVALVIGLSLLTGCAKQGDAESLNPNERVSDAKERTQRFETRVAELIPDKAVTEISQLPHGSLQSCSAGDMWAGGVTIHLRSALRPSAVLAGLGKSAELAGLDVERGKDAHGNERLTVAEESGVSVLLDAGGHSIEGGSFSDCFPLPDEFYRGGEF